VVSRPFTIHAEKCPNRRGVEAMITYLQGTLIDFAGIRKRLDAGEFQALYVASDSMDPWIDEASSSEIRGCVKYLVVQDTTVTPLAQLADAVLAGATFAEKAGSYVNADGRLQYAEAALPPRDGSLPDLDIFSILLGRGAGPTRSRDILAEVAKVVPGFAVAEGGLVPSMGIKLGEASSVPASAIPFGDPWTQSRSLK
jgi:NADH-quinone oxidoreductase subunit G